MNSKLLICLPLILSLAVILPSCAPLSHGDAKENSLPTASTTRSENTGQEYIDSFVFFGESTTYHLKSRGVLSGGTDTTQVWGPKNGTVNLDTAIASTLIVYPETNELISLSDALSRKQPQRILFGFGLNGAVTKIRRGKEYFQACYRLLLDTVEAYSPNTQVFLQSAFPVAENMDMSAYSVDLSTLNEYIATINDWTRELAEEYQIIYLDTASVLRNEDGSLSLSYQVGDGHHLTAEAYQKILTYIAEHRKDGTS